MLKYTLEDINQIIFEGFDYKLNDDKGKAALCPCSEC
jgi:hypothetical protein